MLRRLEELCNLNGVSGNEGAVRKYIKNIVTELADEVHTDAMGNLYAHKKGTGRKIMACAHMDEVGMIVRGIAENGMLAYTAGGIDPRVVVSKRVVVGKDEIPGVIGYKAIHMQSDDEFKRAAKHKDLSIDIGAKDKADAEKYVKLGDYISFTTKFEQFGDGMMRAKALDDRVGCTAVLELLKNNYDCDFYGVFTVQEELGLRGAQAAVANVQPELALILEGTTANDMPEVRGHKSITEVGHGPAISFIDGRTIVRPEMFEAIRACAIEANIPWQLRKGTTGGTDAGVIHKALSGCVCGGISLPCRYIHSPCSVASVSDFENMVKLADYFMKTKKFNEVLLNV